MNFGFLDLFFGIFCVVFLVSTRPLEAGKQGFGRDTTASLRGLAMLMIMIHHIHSRYQGSSPVLGPGGYMGTGLFFFISGYGNMLSVNKRAEVKFGWMLDKLKKLYIPFFVAYWIYFLILEIFYRDMVPTLKELLVDIFTITLPNKDTWFVKIILLCFLVHWVARKLFPDVLKQNIFMVIFVMSYIVVARKMGVKTQWYTTLACYPVGCILARPTLFRNIVDFFKEKKVLGFVLCSMATVFAVAALNKSWLIVQICPIVFSLTCFYYSYIFETKNKFLAWVGNNSFEFYIFHYIFLQGLERIFVVNRYVYAVGVVGCSLLTVYLYLMVRDRLVRR